MRLLLDENLPKKLRKDFPGHQVFTMREKGWTGKSNGILMQLMTADKFDALLTFDQNLQHQQNFKKYSLAVIVLVAVDNSYSTLKDLIPKIKDIIEGKLSLGAIEVRVS